MSTSSLHSICTCFFFTVLLSVFIYGMYIRIYCSLIRLEDAIFTTAQKYYDQRIKKIKGHEVPQIFASNCFGLLKVCFSAGLATSSPAQPSYGEVSLQNCLFHRTPPGQTGHGQSTGVCSLVIPLWYWKPRVHIVMCVCIICIMIGGNIKETDRGTYPCIFSIFHVSLRFPGVTID